MLLEVTSRKGLSAEAGKERATEFFLRLYQFSVDVTSHHVLSSSVKHKIILSQFWLLEFLQQRGKSKFLRERSLIVTCAIVKGFTCSLACYRITYFLYIICSYFMKFSLCSHTELLYLNKIMFTVFVGIVGQGFSMSTYFQDTIHSRVCVSVLFKGLWEIHIKQVMGKGTQEFLGKMIF